MLVDDILQRHTMALTVAKSPEELLAYSLSEGDEWITRNEKYYSQLKNLHKIMRWNDWLYHQNYEANKK